MSRARVSGSDKLWYCWQEKDVSTGKSSLCAHCMFEKSSACARKVVCVQQRLVSQLLFSDVVLP